MTKLAMCMQSFKSIDNKLVRLRRGLMQPESESAITLTYDSEIKDKRFTFILQSLTW